MRANVVCLFGALAMAAIACGKSTGNGSDGAGNGGSGVSAGAGAGGRGGTINTGGSSQGGGGAAEAGRGGTSSAGAPGGGGAGGDALAACRENTNQITISGDLPSDFGTSATLDAGCADAAVGTFPWPVSYTRKPPEAPGMQVQAAACTSDEHLKVVMYVMYDRPRGEVSAASIQFQVDGAILRSVSLAVEETRVPLANWPYPADPTDGIGSIYEGSFNDLNGNSGTVSGTFSTCHVANLTSGT